MTIATAGASIILLCIAALVICRQSAAGAMDFKSAAVILILAAAVISVAAALISLWLSEELMKPVRQLVRRFAASEEDTVKGAATAVYEELEPVAESADKLLDETHRIVGRLKKEKEKFSLITENMAEGMILLDADHTVLSVNRTAMQLFNPAYDPSAKLKINEFTDDRQLLDIIAGVDSANSARGIIRLGEHIWRVFVNKSEYAGKYGVVIILADATESIKSEEIRREFSANVSHELKTPLTTIRGFGEMMENGIISDEADVRKYGGTIYREASRLLTLINDIMRLSEIEEENPHALNESVDLLEAARDCEEILQSKAADHEVTIEINGTKTLVRGSRTYLTELLLNLMDNSVKYNRSGGMVRVTVDSLPECARIVVEDNGIGISEADTERVFERFYRVDKSRSKETGGTGLGLSIVKHVVSLHGGDLKVFSELGKGTRITVTLPFDRAKEGGNGGEENI